MTQDWHFEIYIFPISVNKHHR